jgi:hypothetical protein
MTNLIRVAVISESGDDTNYDDLPWGSESGLVDGYTRIPCYATHATAVPTQNKIFFELEQEHGSML